MGKVQEFESVATQQLRKIAEKYKVEVRTHLEYDEEVDGTMFIIGDKEATVVYFREAGGKSEVSAYITFLGNEHGTNIMKGRDYLTDDELLTVEAIIRKDFLHLNNIEG